MNINAEMLLFKDIKQKDELIAQGRKISLKRGEPLFIQGTAVAHFYIILKGTIQLFRVNSEGQEKTIELLKSGQTICEDEILDGCRHYRLNATAVDTTELLEFPLNWLKESARKYPDLALNLLSAISGRAHQAELEAEQRTAMSATQIVACFLQRLCALYGYDPKNFKLPYSKTLIASRLGMQVETLSRTFPKLEDCGIMVVGNMVSITSAEAIQQNVCSYCSIEGECKTHQSLQDKL